MSSPPPEPNPYAPPSASLAGGPLSSPDGLAEAEATRRAYINHEASVKSIGSLNLLGAFLMGVLTALMATGSVPKAANGMDVGTVIVYGAFTALFVAIGVGLMRLQTWARWVDAALLAFSLVSIAWTALSLLSARVVPGAMAPFLLGYCLIGLIYGYMLYLLVSRKAGVVFSHDYKAVIAATPHIKYKSGCLVKGILIGFVVLIGIGILTAIIGSVVSR